MPTNPEVREDLDFVLLSLIASGVFGRRKIDRPCLIHDPISIFSSVSDRFFPFFPLWVRLQCNSTRMTEKKTANTIKMWPDILA